jgi:hypothetical protein
MAGRNNVDINIAFDSSFPGLFVGNNVDINITRPVKIVILEPFNESYKHNTARI